MPTLYKHQQRGVDLCETGNKLLEWDCGTGKTATGLTVARHWVRDTGQPALIVGIKSTLWSAWMDDAETFVPDMKVIDVWDKDPKKRLIRLNTKADIYVTNYETFKSYFSEFADKQLSCLIFDESSKLKAINSQNAEAALAMAGLYVRAKKKRKYVSRHIVPHRYCLSATPAPNEPYEYWTQVKFCAGPGRAFSDNYYSFRSQYFYDTSPPTESWTRWKVNRDMQQDFLTRISYYCDVVNKEDVVDLPEQVDLVRHVTLSPAEARAYKAFHKDLVLEYAGQEIIAKNALAKIMKLRQLTAGFFYDENKGEQVIGQSKLKETEEILEELGNNQVIIWCQFKYEIRMLEKALAKYGVCTIYNETKDQQQSIRDFKSGAKRVCIAHPRSAGHGLTFINCWYNINFSLDYSWEYFKQSRDRIHRIGQSHPCMYYHLLVPGSVDEVLYKAVMNKRDINQATKEYLQGA